MKILLKSGRDELPDRVVEGVAVRGIGGTRITIEHERDNPLAHEVISLFDYDVEIEE